MYNPYTSYQQNQVLESSPEDTMLQLVHGALIRAKQAQEMWDKDEKARAREKRLQCMEIVCYLDETLDRENGGAIVEELEGLYAYMERELTNASRYDDMSYLAPVEEILSTLYEGWKDAVTEYKKNQKTQQPGGGAAGAQYGQAGNFESTYTSAG